MSFSGAIISGLVSDWGATILAPLVVLWWVTRHGNGGGE